jgi:glucosamine-6-phosphate deaminase
MNSRTEFMVDRLSVQVFSSKAELGAAAAERAAAIVRHAIQRRGRARIVVGTGNSQDELIHALVREPDIDWSTVEVFHLDEYVGMSANDPASFRRWLRTHLVEKVRPGAVNYVAADAIDLDGEMRRYAALLNAAPIDLTFVGFGENGHIAFNDPGVADFADPLALKRVHLDPACRRQQVGEGHFPTLDDVPLEAVTLTCPTLMRSDNWICCVPDRRKAEAVKCALEGPVSPQCPASLARTHPRAFLYLDEESASLLSHPVGETRS